MPQIRIAVVEDESPVAGLLSRQLSSFGYTVTGCADTGEEAVRLAETTMPDLVLMDIRLAGPIDGTEAASQIRSRLNIPIIYLTGDAEPSTVHRAKLAEPLAYLLKPFKPEELHTTIETALYQFRTSQKRSNEALQQAERQYQLIFYSALEGIYQSSPSGHFIAANPALAHMFGYDDSGELLSSVTDIGRQLYARPGRWGELKKVLDERIVVKGFVSSIRRKDGSEIWISENVRAVCDKAGCLLYHEGFVEDITERKRAEDSLRESEMQYRALFETSRDAIMMLDRTGFFDCNGATLEMFGCSLKDQFVSRHPSELSPAFQPNGEDSLTAANRRIETAFQTGAEFFEWTYTRYDGTPFPAEVQLSRMEYHGKTVLQAMVRDISRRKHAEEQLRDSEALYHSLVENLPQNVLRKDVEGRFTFVNQHFCQTVGKKMEEIIGKTDFDFFPADLAAKYRGDDCRVMETGEIFETVEQHQVPGGSPSVVRVIKSPLRDAQGQVMGIQAIFWDITEGRRLGDQLRKLSLAVEQSPASVVITDPKGIIEYVNRKFVEVSGYTPEEVTGKNPRVLKSGESSPQRYKELWETITAGREWRGEFHNKKKSGELFWESAIITPIRNQSGETTHFLAVKEDITERKRAEEERTVMELQLRQAQKLEAIGQLAAGIAHEINTPTQYVGDNTRFLQDAFGDLLKTLKIYGRLLETGSQGFVPPELVAEAEKQTRDADLEYLTEEIPKAITQSLEGVDRVATIVRAMKEFSHPGGEEKQLIDLNHAIESTITVCRNEWKYVAEMVTDFDPDLPPVRCLPGELNQVVLNLIINASHAIGDVVGKSGGKGTITLRTRHSGNRAEISVGDTGTGISKEHRDKIFTPFFTTKEVGRGTGQGLAIAHSVVVGKHGGTIEFETEPGKGTTFIIRLPINPDLP